MATQFSAETGLESFAKDGFSIVAAERLDLVDELRLALFDRAKQLVPYKGESMLEFFNGFHRYGLEGTKLNSVRMDLVQFLTHELTVSRTLHQAFHESLSRLVGADVAAQKIINLVVQQPGDSDRVPIHRDAPSNSHFEVILWLPLVDTYATKSMFILDRAKTAEGLSMLQNGGSYESFSDFTINNGTDLKVPYGSAFFFAAGLAHGCKVNAENETRWSLNVRYKNLFSPYGPKGLAEFFEIIHISPLSEVGFGFERQEFGKKAP